MGNANRARGKSFFLGAVCTQRTDRDMGRVYDETGHALALVKSEVLAS